jgi:flagellin-specific chaperone FliS
VLQFDGEKSIALYDFTSDRLLEHNVLKDYPETVKNMETKLKAIIQQYMERMNKDRLTAGE